MVEWAEPKNVNELHGFMGLTGYYRKKFQGYSLIARPIMALLKKDQYRWMEEAATTFNQLKLAMTIVPVLALPNFEEEFVVESDASAMGL
ncbi:hypothetical protein N665_0187s0031 [Sinapis alba]|nr:hypothetical protein N665_0187s0031 [Sinapis alba]